jgi:hypothetical protein
LILFLKFIQGSIPTDFILTCQATEKKIIRLAMHINMMTQSGIYMSYPFKTGDSFFKKRSDPFPGIYRFKKVCLGMSNLI